MKFVKKIGNRVREQFRQIQWEGGYTLIEIMVVVTIIAILMGVVGASLFNHIITAKIETTKMQMKQFELPLMQYSSTNGNFPTNEDGLEALVQAGLIKRIPNDPWNQPYNYQSPGDSGEKYVVWSNGADKQPGGEGANTDIKSTDL
ncbi:MAG: type II secretion system major pseudopilin GspG [bacterium]|nr:type II secretion system major pseudopilin GspG [bacterium]